MAKKLDNFVNGNTVSHSTAIEFMRHVFLSDSAAEIEFSTPPSRIETSGVLLGNFPVGWSESEEAEYQRYLKTL